MLRLSSKTKAFFSIAGICAVALALGACGSAWTGENAEATTLGIDKNGRVREIVVEDFSEPYYSLEGFQALLEDEIATYLADAAEEEGAEPLIILDDVRGEGGRIRTETLYRTAEVYGDFTQEALFYGTLKQARLRGFEMPSVLTDAADASYTVSGDDVDNHVVFTDGHDHIVTPYRIIACTAGVRLISETEADFSGTEGRAALLLEK